MWDADSVLHEAPVLALDRLACNIPAIYNGSLDDTMFCAGDLVNGRDSCEGDSGGSMVCPVEGIYDSKYSRMDQSRKFLLKQAILLLIFIRLSSTNLLGPFSNTLSHIK